MPTPIVSVDAMRAWEARTWEAGVAPAEVIRRAGRAVGRAAMEMTSDGSPVLVLAGRGHNGDDAEVAAGGLEGREVTLCRVREAGDFEVARAWLDRHRGRREALVVDGLFGIGLNRPLEGAWAALVTGVNRSALPVLAVDVPSGLDAETGRTSGPAVIANRTLTLGAVKAGLLREGAAVHVGRLTLAADIGLVPWEGTTELSWTMAEDFEGYPPVRPTASHKGSFGQVVVVAGSMGYHGAAVLAARGAGRARPGLVSVVTEGRCYVPVASALQSAMVRTWEGEPWDGDRVTAVVVGPGLASRSLSPAWRAEFVRLWHEATCPVVVDASALDWLPTSGPVNGVRVLTPHPGEAGRILGIPAAAVQADRPTAGRALLARWPGAAIWMVLKGSHTLVGSTESGLCVNSTGNPGLAQGGSGDVLAGYLGGLLAQPEVAVETGRAVRFAVWRHGAVADLLEATGEAWTSEDLAASMGKRIPDQAMGTSTRSRVAKK